MEYDTEKLQWLEYDILSHYPHIAHGTFLRHGGVSKAPCNTLNVGHGTSDHHENILANRELIRKALALPKLIFPHQVHGTNVERVTSKNFEKTFQADALFTTERKVILGVAHADCQAAIFYDPMHEAIAVAHAGWKGLVQNIYARVIETLQREVGSQPQNIIVCIAPSLGPDHAEFKNYRQEFPQDFWSFQKLPLHFDLWEIARSQLNALGIVDKNIEISETCTFCQAKDYFSYRRDKDTGRHGTVVALKG